MSMRDMSTYCLQQIIDKVNSENDDSVYSKVISSNLIPQIKTGIKSKTQVFLAYIAIYCNIIKVLYIKFRL